MKKALIKCYRNGKTTIESSDFHFSGENKATKIIVDFSEADQENKYYKYVDIINSKQEAARYEFEKENLVEIELAADINKGGYIYIIPFMLDSKEEDAIKIKFQEKSIYVRKLSDIGTNPPKRFKDVIFQLDEKKLDKIVKIEEEEVDVLQLILSKANYNDIQKLFKDVSLNQANGVLTFTAFDGSIKEIDLDLELVPIDGSFDAISHEIVIELASGAEIRIPVGDLLTELNNRVVALEQNKRDKSVKITKIDMDISANANKLGLENLQDEVIQAISGNAPVNNVIGDNAVVSEKIAEDAINIKHLNNDLKSLFFLNNKYGSDYSFVIGSFAANGLEAPATNRIRSEYITSTNPIIIELIDKIQFNMNVWLYSKEGVYIDRTGLTTEPFVLTNEYMARIVLSYKDNRNINEEDIPTLTNNLILKEQEVKLKDNSIGNSKIIDKAITPEKTNFFDISKNLINIDNAIIGYRLSSVNGELIEDSLYITTEFIEVEPNATYYRSLTFP